MVKFKFKSLLDAAQLAGNWKKFQSFGWTYENDQILDPENWCIIYTQNRDSGLTDQSNHRVFEKELNFEEDQVIPCRHSHWACGWVDGFVIRVFDQKKQITPAFEKFYNLTVQLQNYPLLNEFDYSNAEYEVTLENIKNVGQRWVKEDAPEDWAEQCFAWCWEHNQSAVENTDDQGGYPSDEEMQDCLEALGFLENDEDD